VILPAAGRDRFWTTAEALKVKRPVVQLANGARKATFVRPHLRVRARYMKTEGMLRHASLTALL
jgi:hypothetical protein